LLLLISTVLC
jgi:hypothetical protein